MYAVTRSFANSVRPALRSRRRPSPRQLSSSKRFIDRCNRFTIAVDGASLAARCSRRSLATGVGALTGAGAYGYLYGRHELEVTRADRAGRRTAAGARRTAHRPASPTCIAAAGCRTTTSAHAVTALMSETPDLIVLGGDYVTWGDRALRRRRRPTRSRRCRRRTASSASSAITTTITTCRRRSARNGVQMLKDARTRLDDQRRDDRSRRHPLLDQARRSTSPHSLRGARRHDDPARARSAPADRSGGARHSARALRPHARRTGRAAGRRRRRRAEISRRRRPRPPRPDDDVRQPRRRNGLRAGADQLSAGSRGADAAALLERRRRPRARRTARSSRPPRSRHASARPGDETARTADRRHRETENGSTAPRRSGRTAPARRARRPAASRSASQTSAARRRGGRRAADRSGRRRAARRAADIRSAAALYRYCFFASFR